MRLILLTTLISSGVIIALFRPFIGLLFFSWLGYMRPQNLAWAPSELRFSYYIAIALLVGCLLNKGKEKIFVKARENYLLIIFWLTLGITTIFSIFPGQSLPKFLELTKIIFISIITGGLVNSKDRFKYLAWIIIFSLGVYAVKGAVVCSFTGYKLYGPADSMISDNNDFALALNMILPFFLYLGINEKKRWRRFIFYILFPFIIVAIIHTYSRGGFLGLLSVGLLLILRSKRKIFGFLALILTLALFINFAPLAYKERISTIKTYEEDESAMGRIWAWQAAWQMAKDRPLTGVGLRNFVSAYSNYHWSPPKVAHNSYLQLLAECGFVALVIFLVLLFLSIKKLRSLRKRVKFTKDTAWLHNYSHMLEIGFIAYMVSGFFLSRHDFDLVYQFIGMTVALEHIAMKEKLIK